jgi:hypothetical protein
MPVAAFAALLFACGSEPEPEPGAGQAGTADGGASGAGPDGAVNVGPDGKPIPGSPLAPCEHPNCPISTLARFDYKVLNVGALVAHGDRIYYVHMGPTDPGLYSIAKAGGPFTKLAAMTPQAGSVGESCKPLVTDGIHVYYVTGGATPKLERVPVGGGAIEVISDKAASCPTIEGGTLYWSEPSGNGVERRGVWRRSLGAADAARIIDEDIFAYVGGGANFYWFAKSTLNNDNLFRTAPKTGGVPTTVSKVLILPSGRVVADDAGAYAEDSSYGLQHFPFAGTAPTAVPSEVSGESLRAFVMDGTTLYWNQHPNQGQKGSIMRRLAGVPATALTYDFSTTAHDLATDETHIYFGSMGTIQKLPK